MDENDSERRSSEPLYETHPLDKDYSSPVQAQRTAIPFHAKFRGIGTSVFGAGFVTVIVAAIVLSNFRSNSWIESVGSTLHRFGMILILIGGVLIVVAYRLPHLKGTIRLPSGKFRWSDMQSYFGLVFFNVLGFIAVALASYLSPAVTSPALYFLFINGTLTIVCALMVTLLVWHRGFIRAYAIGVLVALLLNGFFLVQIGLYGSRYWGSDRYSMLLASLAIILISGLVCGGYVYLMESAIARKAYRSQR